MKKVKQNSQGEIYIINNFLNCICPMTKTDCVNTCAWFNIIEIAYVRRVTCHGVEIAELVEDKPRPIPTEIRANFPPFDPNQIRKAYKVPEENKSLEQSINLAGEFAHMRNTMCDVLTETAAILSYCAAHRETALSQNVEKVVHKLREMMEKELRR